MVSEQGSDEEFMRQALAEARKARAAGEVPVGAVVGGVLRGDRAAQPWWAECSTSPAYSLIAECRAAEGLVLELIEDGGAGHLSQASSLPTIAR